ncbi:hypothetical protein [Amycolatopsis sp. NPDC102389]|uniref:hypothetical protein n=1 Tax=Amycolatopsis sp. NPDC102389 TaxID=3363941 RepID=UPI00382D5520
MRDFTDDPAGADTSRELWTTPGEVSSLIRESAGRLTADLVTSGVFAVVAWLAADAVTWLLVLAITLAALAGLQAIWHLVFLIRAALRFADDLDDQAARDASGRRIRFHTDSPTEEH